MFWLALAGLFFRSKSKKYSAAVDQLISMPFAFMRLTAISTEIPNTHNGGPTTFIETMTNAEVTPPDPSDLAQDLTLRFSCRLFWKDFASPTSTTIAPIGFPAIFVGAIYPAKQNDLESTEFESLLSPRASVLGKVPALQQLGIASLSSASDRGLTDMLQAILDHSRNLRSKLPSFAVNELIKPEQYIFDGFKLLPGREAKRSIVKKEEGQSSSRNTRHSALTISEADAKIVKGMLRRGDKQQDIALFFGVNQGRITEIKKGDVFQNVEALPFDQLPPQGPYPLIRDFLGFKSTD